MSDNLSITVKELTSRLPGYVINIASELEKAGFEAYLVGGSLRDVLMDIEPDDFDIATNALPDEITDVFPKSVPTGAQFGTITVVGDADTGERFDVEVTTYRSEADYVGGRWPSKVEFTRTIEEDLARRDFTINAMALDLLHLDEARQLTDVLVDPFGGVDDLKNKLIVAVGDPLERFGEDGLRPVRACRLAAVLGFTIDPKTFSAMKGTTHITKNISVERFREELMKLLHDAPKPSVGLRLMKDSGILELFIPELLEGTETTQPQYHVEPVFDHLLSTVDVAEDSIKLAALFHDIGKPRTISEDESGVHFYGHDQLGAEMTKEIMRRLKFPNSEIDKVVRLVRWHMFYYPSADWRKLRQDDFDWQTATKEKMSEHIEGSKQKKSKGGWSDGAVRRLIQNVGGEEAIDDLMKLRIADASANPKSEFNPEEIAVLSERIAEVRAKEMALKISDLDITGEDIMSELNLSPGPVVGELLSYLLEQVVEEPLLNEKSQLIELARNKLGQR